MPEVANALPEQQQRLAVYRDLNRVEYAKTLILPEAAESVFTGFNAGFDAGLARLIAGVNHE